MTNLPDDVLTVKERLLRHPNELTEVAKKLINKSPELIRMWQSVERRKYQYDPPGVWVLQFLDAARDASKLPSYDYKPRTERKVLANAIVGMAGRLARKLEVYDLDAHIIHIDGKMFNGWRSRFVPYAMYWKRTSAEIRGTG